MAQVETETGAALTTEPVSTVPGSSAECPIDIFVSEHPCIKFKLRGDPISIHVHKTSGLHKKWVRIGTENDLEEFQTTIWAAFGFNCDPTHGRLILPGNKVSGLFREDMADKFVPSTATVREARLVHGGRMLAYGCF
eukprot:TRINITY_DN1512_c0_g1_i6.p1 TRINITY_DN1512_c0_g1~~TRINITY_DN1512_c0_g1_i6.p1  ORF type:complete len:137 (-),score=14.73 TRINITY_DN1512_c0_g1_i6:252-662(-)